MAFDWLGGVGKVVESVGGIASLFRDDDVPPAARSMENAVKEAMKFAKASADPNSEAFKNLEALEHEQQRLAAVQGIRNFLRQIAHAKARGYTGQIINPERRDESVMKALAESFMEARNAARATARQTLANAASSLTGAAGGLEPVVNTEFAINTGNRDRRDLLPSYIGHGLGNLGNLLNETFPESDRGTPFSTTTRLSGRSSGSFAH